MTEEKKDELNEQQTFLDGHEERLKSTNDKKDSPGEQAETVEEVPVSEETDAEGTPLADESSAPESSEPIEEPIVEDEVAVVTEPEPVPEPEPTPEPEPEADAVIETPVEEPQPEMMEPTGKAKEKTSPQQHQHSPQHEEVLKQQALEQREVKEVLVFFRKYAKPAGIAIAVVCVIILADRFFKTQRLKKEAAADTALMDARSAQDLEDIVNDYASTPSGPLALMELAREKFNAGQFDESAALYTRFTKKHADHELAAQAELNLITCKEGKGQFDEAHLLYGQFASKHAGSYLEPSAMMGQARCLEALGQLDEAQIAYEDIIVNFPETGWSRIAEANLKTVLGKKQ